VGTIALLSGSAICIVLATPRYLPRSWISNRIRETFGDSKLEDEHFRVWEFLKVCPDEKKELGRVAECVLVGRDPISTRTHVLQESSILSSALDFEPTCLGTTFENLEILLRFARPVHLP